MTTGQAPQWRKASLSDTQGGNCVEVADLGVGAVGVRDSKNPGKGNLTLGAASFASLISQIKGGKLDL